MKSRYHPSGDLAGIFPSAKTKHPILLLGCGRLLPHRFVIIVAGDVEPPLPIGLSRRSPRPVLAAQELRRFIAAELKNARTISSRFDAQVAETFVCALACTGIPRAPAVSASSRCHISEGIRSLDATQPSTPSTVLTSALSPDRRTTRTRSPNRLSAELRAPARCCSIQ